MADTSEVSGFMPRMDRRAFLGFVAAGGAAVASGPLLDACASANPSQASNNGSSAQPPDYVPRTGVPKPQLAGSPIVSPGYLKAPTPFSAYSGKPLKGGTITYYGAVNGPPIPPEGQNTWWQAIEDAVGAKISSTLVPSQAYQEKTAALIAANDYPDYFLIASAQAVSDVEQLLQAKFIDLSPYLSGKGVRNYPNLANIPQEYWLNNMVGGRIYGVPTPRPFQNNQRAVYRRDLWASAGSAPKNAGEFKSMAKELTGSGRWALQGNSDPTPFNWPFYMQMWRLPNNWEEKSGKFSYWIELPAAKEALAYMIELQKAGVYAPYTPENALQAQLAAGTILWTDDTLTGVPGNVSSTYAANPSSPVDACDVMTPFGHDGKPAVSWNSPGYVTLLTAFSKSSKWSVEDRLRLCDWKAAPTFSTQQNLNSYGVEGVDYTVSNGTTTVTPQGRSEGGGEILTYISAPPFVFYNGESPRGQWATKAQYNAAVACSKIGIDDPSLRLYSPTYLARGATLNTMLLDAIRSVVNGRQPLSYWGTFVTQWRQGGGDAMRTEYQKAFAKTKKSA